MYNSDDLQILDEMINDHSKISLLTNNQKKEVILTEIEGDEYKANTQKTNDVDKFNDDMEKLTKGLEKFCQGWGDWGK
ncbi:hypothetical protein ACN4EE_00440 [Geminocystis sp. CENA526]|uniref:hypothetical protein n=1 Tax=Geminocystis sp. CENA526 TaxID=1355871 RepID=UPI003D6DAD2F